MRSVSRVVGVADSPTRTQRPPRRVTLQGLRHHARRPGGIDAHIRAAPAGERADRVRRIRPPRGPGRHPRPSRTASSRRPGSGSSDHHGRGAGGTRHDQGRDPDHAAAEHHHRLAQPESTAAHRPHRDAQRLGQGGGGRVHGWIHGEAEARLDHDLLRQPAVRGEPERGIAGAQDDLVPDAPPAGAARQVRVDRHERARRQVRHPGAHLHHVAGDLVAHHDGRPGTGQRMRCVGRDEQRPVAPLLAVRAADAGPRDRDADLDRGRAAAAPGRRSSRTSSAACQRIARIVWVMRPSVTGRRGRCQRDGRPRGRAHRARRPPPTPGHVARCPGWND